ncbi:MAG TPA: fasciclin domain-containing protein [Streptosporangiaceae bacterium]|nr:fasciclin domain-containing protein [Streptosporangiaceae bacterium]
MRPTLLIAATATIGVCVAAAGCGSDPNSNSASIAAVGHRGHARIGPASTGPLGHQVPASSSSPEAIQRAGAASRESVSGRTFGPACARLPATGAGSRKGMAAVPVLTAASHNPLLTVLAHAAKVAGLTSTLDSASAVTLFAPDNSAFKALGKGNYKTLMANPADLAKVLRYHVVKGRVTPAELAARKPLPTLAGLPVHPLKSRDVYKVNGVRVICGNLQTANATIYIVDEVLVPRS